MTEMKLSLTETGALVSVFSLFNSVLQPIFGWLEDRLGYYPFLCLSPLWVGFWMGGLGSAPNYGFLVLFLLLAGIGICAFHPASFSAVKAIHPDGGSLVISFLLLATSLGFVAGPSLISLFVTHFGMEKFYLISFPGILATVWLLKILPNPGSRQRLQAKGFSYPLAKILPPILPLFLFALAVSIIAMNLYAFLPILLRQHGASVTRTGLFLSLLSLGCALGPLAGSLSARKTGRFFVILLSSIPPIVLLLLFNAMPPAGAAQLLMVFLLGFFLMLPFSLLISMAQERAPGYTGTVSSFLGGFVWGCGGVLVFLFAKIAESVPLEWLLGDWPSFPSSPLCWYWRTPRPKATGRSLKLLQPATPGKLPCPRRSGSAFAFPDPSKPPAAERNSGAC
jgi:FSR family fosmidomycin resistance protein-like MFS transporter